MKPSKIELYIRFSYYNEGLNRDTEIIAIPNKTRLKISYAGKTHVGTIQELRDNRLIFKPDGKTVVSMHYENIKEVFYSA
jgi:ferredoxin-fold anticodon binding domain-containing protein